MASPVETVKALSVVLNNAIPGALDETMLELERAHMSLEDNVVVQDMYDEAMMWRERADELTATAAQLRRDLVQANTLSENFSQVTLRLEAVNDALEVELQELRAALALAQEEGRRREAKRARTDAGQSSASSSES